MIANTWSKPRKWYARLEKVIEVGGVPPRVKVERGSGGHAPQAYTCAAETARLLARYLYKEVWLDVELEAVNGFCPKFDDNGNELPKPGED